MFQTESKECLSLVACCAHSWRLCRASSVARYDDDGSWGHPSSVPGEPQKTVLRWTRDCVFGSRTAVETRKRDGVGEGAAWADPQKEACPGCPWLRRRGLERDSLVGQDPSSRASRGSVLRTSRSDQRQPAIQGAGRGRQLLCLWTRPLEGAVEDAGSPRGMRWRALGQLRETLKRRTGMGPARANCVIAPLTE